MQMVNLKHMLQIISTAAFLWLSGCYSGPAIIPDDYVTIDESTNVRLTGAEVIIEMKDGEKYNGELLYVRDSTMLLCETIGATNDELSNSIYPIYVLDNHNIQLIEVQGESKVLEGIAIGTVAGIGVGAAIGMAMGDDPPSRSGWISFRFTAEQKAAGLACGLGLVGSVFGLIGGSTNSTYDKEVYKYTIPNNYDYTQLNIFSRYPDNEPEFLQAITSDN